ncbi:uncharacterized protein [Procambarus clarkii]|uniref:uncharacterized protein isoform X2 n=1 Tax=Procambarus clarkii TaxID=6728 RepID=UPI0037433FE8
MKRTATVALAFVNPCTSGYENLSTDPMMPECFKFVVTSKGSWATMRALCIADGTDLAEPKGDLHSKVQQYIILHPDLQDEGFWIGGTDAGHEGIWTWESDGVEMEMGYPDWYSGQPDGGYDANYACLYPPEFLFHSCDNDIKIYALCQI